MYKRSAVLFAALFIFWIIIAGAMDLQHIIVGIFVSLLTVLFWKDLNPKLPTILSPLELLMFGRLILILVGYVIKSNIDLIKILLFSDLRAGSLFIKLEPNIETDWGRVFLSSCITITPGTITIDFDPKTNSFTVHAITRETGIDLYYWKMISEVKDLERRVLRRKAGKEVIK